LNHLEKKLTDNLAFPDAENELEQIKVLFRIISRTSDLGPTELESSIWVNNGFRQELLLNLFNKSVAISLEKASSQIRESLTLVEKTPDSSQMARRSGLASLPADQQTLVTEKIVPLCAFCIHSMHCKPYNIKTECVPNRFCLIINQECEVSECTQFEQGSSVELEES
jgi:hypothetical protein